MFKHTLRFVLVTLLAVAVLIGRRGSAGAFLSPSNPAVIAVEPDPAGRDVPAPQLPDRLHCGPQSGLHHRPGEHPRLPDHAQLGLLAAAHQVRRPAAGRVRPDAAAGWSNCDSVGTMDKNIPVAIPDIVTYPGSDYYELELVEFDEPMHSDLLAQPDHPARLPPGRRGHRHLRSDRRCTACIDPSLNPGVDRTVCTLADDLGLLGYDKAHYLGPVIVADKDRPVRVKFINKLPIGPAGDLFVPVDITIMGAGDFDVAYDADHQAADRRERSRRSSPRTAPSCTCTAGAPRGSRTAPRTSGSPRRAKSTTYPKGRQRRERPRHAPIRVPARQTYYWTNQQSARLMFYHDHAWGITRVNVYVGEAAGYLIRDDTEQALVAGSMHPRRSTRSPWSSRTRPSSMPPPSRPPTRPGPGGRSRGTASPARPAPNLDDPGDRRPVVAARLHAGAEPLRHLPASRRWGAGPTAPTSGRRPRTSSSRSPTPTTTPTATR